MNPEPTPEVRPESAPPAQPEGGGQQTGPEQTPVTPEREEVQPETQKPGEGAAVLPPVQPLPADDQLMVPITPPSDDTPADDDDSPGAAEDVDVIEKEWVSKAKQVIARTKDDPHAQEAAFEKLQREYLKKRYGKEIKSQV